MTYFRDFADLRNLFMFLDRMNTNIFEIELTFEYPETNTLLTQHGTVLQNKSTISLRGVESIFQIQHLIEENAQFRHSQITQIRFTNPVISGTIDIAEKKVNIIFHTIENIENILHQLVDIPIPNYELNLKIIHTAAHQRRLAS